MISSYHATTSLGDGPLEVPDLPPFASEDALTVLAVCKLGLVPGVEGRRITTDELERWSTEGYRIGDADKAYRFPTVLEDGVRKTTPAWCSAWIDFVAEFWEQSAAESASTF
jgi:hypothetical protein